MLFLAQGFLLHRGEEFGIVAGNGQITAEHGGPLRIGAKEKARILTHPPWLGV
ncbi:hypothetical protein D3C80_2192270 [compost metagenome]